MDYYVYILFDTKTNDVFYVGKGKGFRIDHHENDAIESEKTEKIKALQKDSRFGKRIVGRYATENEAHAVETVLIKWVYGFDNLTNKVHGRYSALIRTMGDYENIPGIDVEYAPNLNDGSFTKAQQEKFVKNNIEAKLESIKENIEPLLEDTEYSVSEIVGKSPSDTGLWINNPSMDVSIRLKLPLAGRTISPEFVSTNTDKESKARFTEAMAPLKINNGSVGSYIGLQNYLERAGIKKDIEVRPRADDIDEIFNVVTFMMEQLQTKYS
ncbi:hypothetical protein ACE41O_02750 [Alteromonas macleodii]|jgi:hypothetical protein|uniref:GIY-YIG nuclease family protein n=1 Tax=Alteromonas macleodii TaxID=28108 RepID=UPI00314043C0|tara:strand:- start:92 stop:898 length:807 start_codon:yes stop_codon:yes gene_type:complete